MRLLILGGTVFVGRHLVEDARRRGYAVTLFNRGQHNPELFPEVTKLRGDRDGGLEALAGDRWDAVIDTCGYVPRIVRDSAALLADRVDHYTFISSISVFSDLDTPHQDEDAPVGTLEDETVEEVTGETYGPLKALCEQAAEAAMPGRTLTIRPGLIVGPHDPTDRFTYWPHRIAAGGDVLAPGDPATPVQFIDARDLASWTLDMIAAGETGIYNATGPDYRLSMGRFLDTCNEVAGGPARLVWVNEDFLAAEGTEPWSELPLYVPTDGYAGFATINVDRAVAKGLTFRPLATTVGDTLAWDRARAATELRAGLSAQKERALLTAWSRRPKA